MPRKAKAASSPPEEKAKKRENIVGENIRYLLEKRGQERGRKVTDIEFARSIGVNNKTIYFWKAGRVVPDSVSRPKICDYFNITEAELFSKGLAVGLPSAKEDELIHTLVTELNLQGVSPDDIRRLSPDRKRVIEDLIKDWSAQRSRQVQEIRVAQATAGDGKTDARKKILLIDDEAQLSAVLREKLQEMGYRVELAEDGEAGMRWVLEFKPDLILLDLLMEGVDGAEFLRRLHEMNLKTKVIVVSSFPSEMHAVYVGPYKIVDYCQKPVKVEELMEKIEKHAGRAIP